MYIVIRVLVLLSAATWRVEKISKMGYFTGNHYVPHICNRSSNDFVFHYNYKCSSEKNALAHCEEWIV